MITNIKEKNKIKKTGGTLFSFQNPKLPTLHFSHSFLPLLSIARPPSITRKPQTPNPKSPSHAWEGGREIEPATVVATIGEWQGDDRKTPEHPCRALSWARRRREATLTRFWHNRTGDRWWLGDYLAIAVGKGRRISKQHEPRRRRRPGSNYPDPKP